MNNSNHETHTKTSNASEAPPLNYPEQLAAPVMSETLSRAIEGGFLSRSDRTVVFYDLTRLKHTLTRLADAFPAKTLHAVAVKANPLLEILKQIQSYGHGAEVASVGELKLALAAGVPTEKIVFDSPVKTHEELAFAMKLGIRINANTFGELSRIASLYSTLICCSPIGVRINPEIGSGSINATSVAVQHSKFGVGLEENSLALARAFAEYPWLTGLHVHIGSQGMSTEQLIQGVGTVYDFFKELRRNTAVRDFNIGGGLAVKYRASDVPTSYQEYVTALRRRCPELFTPEVTLVTEFGRSVHASCGWVATKVEYIVEHGDGMSTLFVHIGGDMFVRKAYRPEDWHHHISVCDSDGQLRQGQQRKFRVAGPLCFAGDYLDRNVSLPESVSEGDYVLIHDSGAYTFSMWSLYNSRQFPTILGYSEDEGFRQLRPRQSIEESVAFWSSGATK